jgi:hypothetical protein
MATNFGNSAGDFAKWADGTYGYILKIPVKELNIYSISSVVPQASDINGTPAATPTTLDALVAMPEDANCGDFAWYYANNLLYLFFKEATYAYGATTRFAIIGTSIAMEMGDFLDVEDKDIELFINLCIKEAAQIQGKNVPDTIRRNIDELTGAL